MYPRLLAMLCAMLLCDVCSTEGAVASDQHAALTATYLGPMTLHGLDPCFYSQAPAGTPHSPFGGGYPNPIRSGMNDPRTEVHMGDDVWAPANEAAVYAMLPGPVSGVLPGHFVVGIGTHKIWYWHVTLERGITNGTWVREGQLLGHIFGNYWHVHISEESGRCGLVDPRRPTGVLHDGANAELPVVGEIKAKIANAAAYIQPQLSRNPATLHDPATPIALGDLHGVVDLRASATDTPSIPPPVNPASGDRFPEHAQTPAGVRGWLAPRSNRSLAYGQVWRFRGARLFPSAYVRWIWAFGTWREDACYYLWKDPAARCAQQIIWHTAGGGFDTRSVPNGPYQYCVEAITVNSKTATRCQPVTVDNQ